MIGEGERSMFRVMLVDDKKIIVDGLEILIDWNELGFEVFAKTTSAKEAIEISKNQKIDLVITDIRMPEMLGMDMISEISSFSPKTKFVLLSAYSEFEYAKWAIDFQISGYLLKPIDEDELRGLLVKIRGDLEKESEYTHRSAVNYFTKVLAGDVGSADKIPDAYRNMETRYVKIKEFKKDIIDTTVQNGTGPVTEKVSSSISKYRAGGDTAECFVIKNGFKDFEMVIDETSDKNASVKYANRIKQSLTCSGILDFVIFIGKRVEKPQEVYRSKDSVKILEDALFFKSEQLFLYEDYKDVHYCDYLSDVSIVQSVIDAINTTERDMIEKSVNRFSEEIVKEKVRPEIVCGYINKIIFDMIDSLGENSSEAMTIVYKWSLLRKTNCITHDMVNKFLMEITEEFAETLIKIRNRRKSGVIGDIIEYVKRDYANKELNINWISKRYFVTPAYLGKIFKEKTGVSFNNYLMQIRMKRAKELLTNTEYKIYEIAQMVGFTDYNYFHVKFQGFENMSPASYRKKTRQGGNENAK